MFLIVGLGNPGTKYEGTRHNAGRIALSHLISSAQMMPPSFERHLKGEVTRGKVGGQPVTILYPSSQMNLSGDAVATAMTFEQIAPEELMVVHDDIDLPIGSMRISFGRGSGGHNGVASVARSIGTQEFVRIRIGISPVTFFGKMKKPQGEGAVATFVLRPFTSGEHRKIEKVGEQVAKAIECIVTEGKEAAMNRFN